jgi:hypothetical protein
MWSRLCFLGKTIRIYSGQAEELLAEERSQKIFSSLMFSQTESNYSLCLIMSSYKSICKKTNLNLRKLLRLAREELLLEFKVTLAEQKQESSL